MISRRGAALTLGAVGALTASLALGQLDAQAQAPAADQAVDLSAMLPAESIGAVGALEPGQLDALTTARVQPIAFMDTTSALHLHASLEAASQLKGDDVTARASAARLEAPAQDGLGFGGASRQVDILTMSYGYALGVLPLLKATQGDALPTTLERLKVMAPLHASYSAETRAQIEAYLASASGPELSHAAYLRLLRAASLGIAQAEGVQDQRVHGYLLAGLWAGLATLASESGSVPPIMAPLGQGIEEMMLKDASFGGSDQQVAAQLKRISAQLAQDTPNKALVSEAVKALLSIKADG